MPLRSNRQLCLIAKDTSAIRHSQWQQKCAFSTTAPKALPAPAKKKTTGAGPPKKGVAVLRIKKKGVAQSTAKPPAAGERKALRKRIVLSNTNALDVPGLQEMRTGTLCSEASVGKVLALPGEIVDKLRAVEAFKSGQGWSFFARPACLIRNETVQLARDIDGSGANTSRKIICGEKGVGKSVLLLEAMAMAFMKGWVVLNIPEGRELTIGHTAYEPIPNSSPVQYSQPAYTANLLAQLLKANRPLLSSMQLTFKPEFTFPTVKSTTLADLAEAGSNDPDRALPIFEHIWKELQVPGRPPVLYCIDNISHIMGNSKYSALDAEDKLRPIHAHDFVHVRHFLDHLTAERKLQNGGMVLAATSLSEHIKSAALDIALKAMEARQAAKGEETRVSDLYDPYQKMDMRAFTALTKDFSPFAPRPTPNMPSETAEASERTDAVDTTASSETATETGTTENTALIHNSQTERLGVIRLSGITKEEAKSILEYWARSGMVRRNIEEKFVADQWTVSGGGVLREMEKGCLRRLA